jgi:phosphopantetheinyl transferase (holo-ACP synthase)
MDKQPKNLFPATLQKSVIEIFGEQAMQPVLLRLLAPTAVGEAPFSDSDSDRMLHTNELAILSGYKFPKRRSEYLTGRICAKMAVQGFAKLTKPHPAPLTLPEIEIVNTTKGRPRVLIHPENAVTLKMDISIAHSGDYAVALATESRCGIDLQRQDAALLRVQKKFCSETEYRLLETSPIDIDMTKRLNILWAAKEAAKKALSYWQMPGFLDLELRELKNSTNCIALSLHITHTKSKQMVKEVTVAASIFDEYALAICLIKKVDKNAGTT